VGVQSDNGIPVHLLDEETWDRVLNVNVKSHFLMAKHCLPGMLKQRSGCIVNVGSVQGRQSQVRGCLQAVATDACVHTLRVRCLLV
jgi:NAD(P)-dependent dehydrogenase (short-subunit alcohol dehydrogenase family)